jgi:hypothetical protein
MEATEATEPIDRIDPAEPIDRIDPAEPIDKIDPAEPIDRIDPVDPMLSSEPTEPAGRGERRSAFPMPRFSHPGATAPRLRRQWDHDRADLARLGACGTGW